MKRLVPAGLRAQISAVVVVPAIAIAILASLASLWALHRISGERTVEAMHRATERTEMSMQASEQAMQTVALALATNPAIVAAAAARDTDAFIEMLPDIYESLLESDPRIGHLEVGGVDSQVLFRAHLPDRRGDFRSAEHDVREALAGRVATGVIISNATGRLLYGATVPLRSAGTVVGTLRVAGTLDAGFASVVAALTGGEAILVSRGTPQGATLQGVSPELLEQLLRPDSAARLADGVMLDVPGVGTHLLRTIPINDMRGQPAGAIIFGLPMRDWQAAERWATLATLGAAMLGLVLAIPLALILAGRLAALIRRIASAMSVMAGGNLSQPIPGTGRRDEVGAMADALEVFRDKLAESRRLEEAAQGARLTREKRAAALDGYTQDFGQSIAGVMTQLEQASQGMSQAARQMSGAVSQTSGRASGTAGEATEASESLTAVAAAVEQMSASVGEISRQVATAATVAAEAVEGARTADARMRALTGSADQMGEILALIADVAARTNLLALNATIEAARAGDAGKGFAVVASEVKQLAAQTARATDDVGTQLTAMRAAAAEATAAMGGMTRTIARIDEVATTIAAAVEEQGASTREITQRLQGVAASTGGVTKAMGDVLRLARESGAVSHEVEGAAAGLGAQAATLRAEVEGFLHNLRSEGEEKRSFVRRELHQQVATVTLQGREMIMPLVDISAGGAGLRFDGNVAPGTAVSIALPGAPAFEARVARCAGGLLGLVFGQNEAAAVDRAVERLCAEVA